MPRSKIYRRNVRSANPPESKPDNIQKFLLNPTLILALTTALLYFHGQASYSGYISYWGINPRVMPLSFEETLVDGALNYLFLGLDHWKYLAVLVIPVFMMYALVFLLLSKRPALLIYNLIHTRRLNDGQKALLGEAADRFSQFGLLLGIIVLILLTSILSVQKGKARAAADHQKIHNSAEATKPFKKVTIRYSGEQNRPSTVSGSLIESTASMFALHTDSDDILLIPASRLISIRHHDGRQKSEN